MTCIVNNRTPPSGGVYGFSLLELSIVLVIIGTIAGAGVAVFTVSIEKRQRDITAFRMAAIQKALLDYRRAFNMLPCPADAGVGPNAAEFGRSTVGHLITEDCTLSVTPNFSSGDMWGGGVPTRMLKLPDEYAFDGWGRHIMYHVDGAYTLNYGFDYTTITSTGDSFQVQDVAGTVTNAAYVLVSFGANGHGAYSRAGSATRLSSASVNTDEYENCDCGSTGAYDSNYDGVFIQQVYTVNTSNPYLDVFDDIVVYGTRQSLRSLLE